MFLSILVGRQMCILGLSRRSIEYAEMVQRYIQSYLTLDTNIFFDDPTYVRVVTPLELKLFSKRLNQQWRQNGVANSPLGLYLDVNLELKEIRLKPSSDWFRLHPEKNVDLDLLIQESNIYNNIIEEYDMVVEVLKNQTINLFIPSI